MSGRLWAIVCIVIAASVCIVIGALPDTDNSVSADTDTGASVYTANYDFVSGSTAEIDGFTYRLARSGDFRGAQLTSFGTFEDGSTLIVPETVSYGGIEYTVVSIGRDIEKAEYYGNNQKITISLQGIVSSSSAGYSYYVKVSGLVSVNDFAFAKTEHQIWTGGQGWVAVPSGLKGIEFSKGVLSIGIHAFHSLQVDSFDLLGCTHIGNYAFAESSIKTIDIPHIESIGTGAFYGCSSLTTVKTDSDIVNSMFAYCTVLSSVELGPQSRSISNFAFAYSGLTELTVPDTCTRIGDATNNPVAGPFYQTNLASFTASNAEFLGSYLFFSCKSLVSAIIHGPYTEISEGLFNGCSNLEEIDINPCATVGAGAFTNCTKLGDEDLVPIMAKVTAVGNGVFSGTVITVAELPLVESVGANAFASCTLLQKAVFGPNCTDLVSGSSEHGLFYNCSSLREVDLGNPRTIPIGAFCKSGITFVDLKNAVYIGDRAFESSSIESISAPSVETIGKAAFKRCPNLVSVELGPVTVLSEEAFFECTSLKTLSVSANISQLGNGALTGCDALSFGNLVFDADRDTILSWSIPLGSDALVTDPVPGTDAVYYYIRLNTIANGVPSTVSVFVGTANIADVPYDTTYELPVNLIGLLRTKFSKLISHVTISDDNPYYKAYYGVLYSKDGKTLVKAPYIYDAEEMLSGVEVIGEYAFANSRVQSISLPSTITTIKSYGLASTSIVSVVLNEGLVSIGDYAFSPNITKLTIPSTVETLGSYIFQHISKLQPISVEIEPGSVLRSIADYSMYVSGAIYLPPTLEHLGKNCLGDKVTEVYLGVDPSILGNSFMRNSSAAEGIKFYLPLGSDVPALYSAGGGTGGVFAGYYVIEFGKFITFDTKLSGTDGEIYFVSSVGDIEPYWVEENKVFAITSSLGYTHYDLAVSAAGEVIGYAGSGYPVPDGTFVIYVDEKEFSAVCTITFLSNGGTSVPPITVGSGRTVLPGQLPVPYLDLNAFQGWFSDPLLTYGFTEGVPVTSDLVLYAKWVARDPVVFVSAQVGTISAYAGDVVYEPGTVVTPGTVLTFKFNETDSIEFISWTVSDSKRSFVSEDRALSLSSLALDTTVTANVRYYALSDTVPSYIITDAPGFDDDILISWSTNNPVNTSMSVWTGGSSVPLAVDDYIYIRVADKIWKIESDTGYVVKTCDSATATSYYHMLGYAYGIILDYKTGNAYNLDLEPYDYSRPSGDMTITQTVPYDNCVYMFYTAAGTHHLVKYDSTFRSVYWDSILEHQAFQMYNPSAKIVDGGYIYYVYAEGDVRALVSLDCETGHEADFIMLSDIPLSDGSTIAGYYLDDGWLTAYDSVLHLTCYSMGLFGATVGKGDNGYIISVPYAEGKFITDSVLFTDTKHPQAHSAFIVFNGRGYVNCGGNLCVYDVSDMSYIYSASMQFSHGSIVLGIQDADESTGERVYIYSIPYTPNSGLDIASDAYSQRLGTVSTKNIKLNQYNSQAVRSDLRGDLIWYNDTGHLYSATTADKNVYYFFIDDGENACWYRAYGANMYEAAKTLGASVLGFDDNGAVANIFGNNVSNAVISVLHDYEGTATTYTWAPIETFSDRTYDGDHYILVLAEGVTVSAGDSFVYRSGGELRQYFFKDNIGDRGMIGTSMVVGDTLTVSESSETVNADGTSTVTTTVTESVNGPKKTVTEETVTGTDGSTISVRTVVRTVSGDTEVRMSRTVAGGTVGLEYGSGSVQVSVLLPSSEVFVDAELTAGISTRSVSVPNAAGVPVLFDIVITASGSEHPVFGSPVSVSIGFVLAEGRSAEDVAVWYVSDSGAQRLDCTYDTAAAEVVFETDHLSTYAVGYVDSGNHTHSGLSSDAYLVAAAVVFLIVGLLGYRWYRHKA